MPHRRVGLKIKEQREVHKMSQEELAGKIGKSASFIGMIEAGKSNPSLKSLEKIAAAFNLDTSYFLLDNTITVDKYVDHLSQEEKEFILNRKSRPFIQLAKEFFDTEIDPDKIRIAVQVFKDMASKSK